MSLRGAKTLFAASAEGWGHPTASRFLSGALVARAAERTSHKKGVLRFAAAQRPLERGARFLRGHPAAKKHEGLLEQLTAEVRYHSTEEMVDGFKAQFDGYVEEALANIDAQEQRSAPAASS